ncbi:MAG: A24 family peptidase C-terminal domain-containing protein [Zestosphaera sp.]
MDFSESVIVAATLVTLSYASVTDLKHREVKEYVWVPATVVAVLLNTLLGRYGLLELFLASLPAVLVLVLALLDMMGGADFLALLVVTLAHPRIYPKPVTYLTLIYSLAFPAALILWNLVQGLKNLNRFKKVKCSRGSKFMLLFLGRPARVGDFLGSKFTYLLTIPSRPEEDLFECRMSFSMDDIHEEGLKEYVSELVRGGRLGLDELIWVTPGMPQIAFYLLGYIAALITPEALLRFIIPST